MSNNIKKVINKKNNLIVGLIAACTVLIILLVICLFMLFGKADDKVDDAIKIETPYCDLYYPDKWEDQVRVVKNSAGDEYIVEFYGTVGAHSETKLFDFVLNSADGAIGYIDHKKHGSVGVKIETFRTEGLDLWSEDDRLELCSMQEDVNFIIDNLIALEDLEIK